jgi:hypothetical protein
MKLSTIAVAASLCLTGLLSHAEEKLATDSKTEWISMFNGTDLSGWKSNDENPDCFSVEDGALKVSGGRAHLFYVGETGDASFTDFEFKAKVKTMPNSNSGIYFHTEFQENGWPDKGYEAQVNATHQDPKKTGSLYAVVNVYVHPANKPDKPETGTSFTDEKTGLNHAKDAAPNTDGEWCDYHILVQGKTIEVRINGELVAAYTEQEGVAPNKDMQGRLLSSGTFALQGHDPKSTAYFKDMSVRPIPAK